MTQHAGVRETLRAARPRVSLSTRLLLPLLAAVSLVMLAYATWSLRQREGVFVSESERETRAYANALGLALERAVGRADPGAVQEMIDRIDRDPNIYGVIVYDTDGQPQYVSSPLVHAEPVPVEEVKAVLPVNGVRTLRREILGEESVVVLRPLFDEGGEVRGVLEVVQPLTSVNLQLARTRLRFVLNTITLVVAVTLLLSWLVRRYLSEPLEEFMQAVRELGQGKLTHRVEPTTAVGELAEVAEELNRMADSLEEAQATLLRESEERVSLERRLLQAEKLAELGELAAGLAHEIGAPLHVIRGRADLVLRGAPDAQVRERNLTIIVQQIDRIAVIVRNLLGFARRREPRMVPVELETVVRGVTEFVDVDPVRNGARLIAPTAVSELHVMADADLLHQVLLNVLLNALHAVDGAAGGKVMIRTQGTASSALIEIEDDGPGVPPHLWDRVFEPFYTTKGEGRGTGLGLALARGIVEDHGGTIAFVQPSGPEWSTRVRIELPRLPEVRFMDDHVDVEEAAHV